MSESREKFMATGKSSGKNSELAMRVATEAVSGGATKIVLEIVDCDELTALRKENEKLRRQVEIAVEALKSIGATGVQDFDERLQSCSRGDLISSIDTDTAVARDTLAQIEALKGEER